jgi:hypothetical protein
MIVGRWRSSGSIASSATALTGWVVSICEVRRAPPVGAGAGADQAGAGDGESALPVSDRKGQPSYAARRGTERR